MPEFETPRAKLDPCEETFLIPGSIKGLRLFLPDFAPHLAAYYQNPRTHEVDTEYAKAVRKRFGQWILDTARAKYDQAWRDCQYEIGLRHHRAKKNQTDNGHTVEHIRGRDIFAFVPSIGIPMKVYLAKNGHPPEVVERMYEACWKSMVLQATLWCQPYFHENDF